MTGHERPSSVETELMVVRERASCEFSEKIVQVCSLEKAGDMFRYFNGSAVPSRPGISVGFLEALLNLSELDMCVAW